ncbi:MAG: preprotein translocase subunit SecY [Bacteroidetes bacterium]|jgi:preprotein translocase subunit SecY|nr:preprotein translocase subunit SecY [Bacteroidota bacterium]HQW47249.1 preprotein translocase subunit SecY [Chitinophagaceae bacterium]MBK6821286.1 preprotein translocase subunit SecY [Bacteroidota bacterium]MBK7040206.1 preprotein translocase subunit SecY [Bacteroidota bacterium]MBK7586935.1 preprotein translocase subunit SecY [Bacteroidota bacterium]
MKKIVDTFKNIWSIDELRNRIIFTLTLLLVYRVGCHVVLPGINPNDLITNTSQNGLLGLFNMFAGGAFNNASIFALGIMPYISASIAMQLAQIAIPQLQKMSKEDSGRKKITLITRYVTVAVTLFQAIGYITYLRSQNGNAIMFNTFAWSLTTIVILTTGTLFVMWLGEKITDKGIGNGTSLIITAGIIARLPSSIGQEFASSSLLIFLIEIAVMVLIIMAIILLVQGTRRIPLNYARRIVGASSAKDISGNRDFIPIKVNSSGVMPIIFAQAMLFIPSTLVGFSNTETAQGLAKSLSNPGSMIYNIIYAILVIGFTYLYTALIFNPTQMADDLKRNNGFIPGIKPGQDTADYIGAIMDRITLPGAIFLALIGIMPGVAGQLHITQGFASFYGGTSMLIMVGVVLDTLQQIESQLLMRHYDGLMKTGRITGRQAVSAGV